MSVFLFTIFAFVCWRITHLFTKEDGPFNLIYQLRIKAGTGFFGSLLDCFYCASVWVALPLGMWQGNTWWEKLLFWWALSGAACLLEQATTNKKEGGNPDFKED